jgi:hypothetical protein
VIEFANERVVSFSLEYQDVFWEVRPTTEDLQQYEFFVQRSESEAGPWKVIAGPLVDRYYVRDNGVPMITTNARTLFYRIRALHVPSGRELYSATVDREGVPNLLAQEMIRRERILFEEFVGTRCWLFPRRSFGQRCPNCYDDILGKKLDSQCPTCWGTGFSGGYHYPISFWGQIDSAEETEQVTTEDHRRVQHSQARTGPSPAVKPLDLVIDFQNRRWRVIQCTGTTSLGATVRQEFRLAQIQRGSIEDKIPLKIETSSVQLVPPRNFVNAHTLEASEGTSSDFFGLYGVSE